MSLVYEKSIEILTSQGKFHICLGLERVKKILELFGNPQEKLKVIQVAGTNGKGSTSSILANILTKSGYKTGLYTSPHLFEYVERVKISNQNISKNEFGEYVSQVCKVADENDIHLTEFEILTVLAYRYFFDQNVDFVIMETGLGGRLDATNVVSKNLLSIITSISIDHVDRLGDTIEKIAGEKAGIIKEKSVVVVSRDNLGFEVISDRARAKGAIIKSPDSSVELEFKEGINYAIINGEKFEFSLLGLWQKQNLLLVDAAVRELISQGINISKEAIKDGLKTVFWPARMQYIKEKNIIIDGAHNVDAATKLAESLDFYFPDYKRTWIYGTLDTKEYEKIVKTLFKPNDKVYLCKFNNKHSVEPSEIRKNIKIEANEIKLPKAENMLNNYEPKSVTIVSGSFYMIGEIFNSLGL